MYLQHGFGKSDIISQLSAADAIDGVILSPGNESPVSLELTAANDANEGLRVRVDPQSFIYSMSPAGTARYHADHEVDFRAIHWSQSTRRTESQVRAIGRLNDSCRASDRVAPTVMQASFIDTWTPLSLQFAREASEQWGGENTLATLAINERAFEDWTAAQDWLDIVTTLDVRGHYLLIEPSETSYPPARVNTAALENSLRATFALSQLNGRTVQWGYADIDGLVALGAGADSFGSGWSYSLRRFKPTKWQPQPRGGGQQPRARVFLESLLSAPLTETELFELANSERALGLMLPDDAEWLTTADLTGLTKKEAQVAHLARLGLAAAPIERASFRDRLQMVAQRLENASARLDGLEGLGMRWARSYRERVAGYQSAFNAFRASEGL